MDYIILQLNIILITCITIIILSSLVIRFPYFFFLSQSVPVILKSTFYT